MTVSKAKLADMSDQVLSDVWRPSSEDNLPGHFDVLRDLVSRISYAFANATEMTATLAANRVDGQIAIKLDDYTLWVWKDADATAADALHIAPSDLSGGAGRWVSMTSAQAIGYTANPSGNWASAAPTTVQSALDRLATKVKALNSNTAIP